jgi:hypothetical protein
MPGEIKVLGKRLKLKSQRRISFQGSKVGKKARPLPHRVNTWGTTRLL